MSGPALELVPEPDPDDADNLLLLRARVATDIAAGRRSEVILEDLAHTLTLGVHHASATIVTIDRNDCARVRSSDAPTAIQRLMHGSQRRRWFGSWGAALARMTDIVVPEIAGSSLYREHRATFVNEGLLAARAEPITGEHGLVAGVIVLYLREQRLLDETELALLQEVVSLAQLTVRRDQARGELLDRIRYDALTGLENRDGLEEHLRAALAASKGQDRAVGLLFVDIDDLTLVNDSLGHMAGDTVIAVSAERIQRQLLPGDVVVRFGGDEFIVVLERIDSLEEAKRVGERIRDAIGEVIQIDGTDLITTVSIGITEGTSTTPPLQLIDEGHAAVVRAKQSGRGSTAVHDRALDTGAGERLDREVRLREALDNDEFCLHWQPKVSLATGQIVGAEALVRWDHPERGTLSPDEFIATAERSGLMNELSDWILRRAVAEAMAFTELDPEFSVAINLSATQMTRESLLDTVRAALTHSGLAPKNLIIELTESVLANAAVVESLGHLGELGVRTAIDDFGTGYSSLTYVQQLPMKMVKIDRAFLEGLESTGTGAPILKAAVAMAQALDMSTTVEGVENRDQLAGLRVLGVDWAQGFLFSEPTAQAVLVAQIKSDDAW